MNAFVGEAPGYRFIDPFEPGVIVRWTNYASMQHSGHLHVVHKVGLAGDNLCHSAGDYMLADSPQLVRRLEYRIGVDLNIERLSTS